MSRRVLGIDLASAGWASVGSATIAFDDCHGIFTAVRPAAIAWPKCALTPATLADVIDRFARQHELCAVALDGPQGWRNPGTPQGIPGVGRRCEYAARTQGKTGAWPTTYPRTQRAWIEFSIATFDRLLEKPGVELADRDDWEPSSTYGVLECFPTSAWRASGLKPLPAKSKRPPLQPFVDALRETYLLPPFTTESHDDLQAVVAALTAVGAAGGPLTAIPRGEPSATLDDGGIKRRVEGLIWDVKPIIRAKDRAVSAAQFPADR